MKLPVMNVCVCKCVCVCGCVCEKKKKKITSVQPDEADGMVD